MSRRPPPKKRKRDLGEPKQVRRLDGDLLDVATAARSIGDTEKGARAKISRGLLPHRRLGGRIVILRDELHAFLRQLPGVTVDQALENVAARQGDAR
jgi:hypothetical protein